MAAIRAPERTAAQHQSLLHFVGEGTWSDEKVLAKVREMVLPEIERHGPIEAWIIDDTGFPKKGRHSVGVGRQYCGELGKQDNCQIAVTLSIANHHASLPAAYRLYLPIPVPLKVFDETIKVLKSAMQKAKLGRGEELGALRRLDEQSRNFKEVISWKRSPSRVGRLVQPASRNGWLFRSKRDRKIAASIGSAKQ